MPSIALSNDFHFPPLEEADEDGLLVIGGQLTPGKVLEAYHQGIFPWYGEDEPVMWWAPDPRFVLFPHELHVSRSMHKVLRQQRFNFTLNQDFSQVIHHCKVTPRAGQSGTWITRATEKTFNELHHLGYAISAEAWQEGKLVGGVYGILLEKMFCAESMFSIETNASKFVLIHLVEWLKESVSIIDCQVYSAHLESLGARMISRKEFCSYL